MNPHRLGTSATNPVSAALRSQKSPTAGKKSDRRVAVLGSVAEVPVCGSAHERAATLAEYQRGYVRRAQLLAAGVSSSTFSRMVLSGSLIYVHRGVVAVGHRPSGALSRETAALLAVRDGAAISHSRAAALWEYPGAPADGPIEVTVPGPSSGRPEDVVLHRSRILAAVDVRVIGGLPVTSPERTLLDLAVRLGGRELERDLEHALRQTPMTMASLRALLRRSGAHHGRRSLSELLAARAGASFTRSEAEERFLALVRAAGLSLPLINARRNGYEVDFLWPEARLAVEIDGYAFHGGRGAFEHDRRKDADLLAAGIVVIRLTWRQLTEEATATIVRVAQLLAARAQ